MSFLQPSPFTADKTAILVRIGIFLLVWIAAWAAIAFPAFQKFRWRPFQATPPNVKLALLLPLYGLAPMLIWGANQLLGQSWQELGVVIQSTEISPVILGFAIAVAGIGLLLVVKVVGRWVVLQPAISTDEMSSVLTQKGLTIFGLLVLAFGIGGIEEVIFRGWIHTQLEAAFSPWLAATFGSALFAVAHLVWDGRSGIRQQPGLFLLGWVLVVARWATGGSLALAWGLHAGWVWGLACVAELLDLQPAEQAPPLLSGRSEQPLTSILDLILLISTACLVWWTAGTAVA